MSSECLGDFVAKETTISVFISSRMSPVYEWARLAAFDELNKLDVFDPWLFEAAPASTEETRDGYLRRVEEADLVLWLVGRDTTEAVFREIRTALQSERPILIFRIDDDDGDQHVEELIRRAGGRWSRATSATDLRPKLAAALQDELVRGFRRRPASLTSYLEQLRDASFNRCVERWLALGVSEDIARALAGDSSTGALTLPSPGLTILTGPMGSGKSLAAERLYQHAISVALGQDRDLCLPFFFEARATSESILDQIDATLQKRPTASIGSILAVLDGLDEAADRESLLLSDARRLVLRDSRNVVVLTSRKARFDGQSNQRCIIEIPPLSEGELLSLMTRVAGREVGPSELWGVSEAVREAIGRPLFAILAANTARERWLTAHSAGALLWALVERSLGRVEARQSSAEPMLRKLARLSLDLGQSFLDPQTVGAYPELGPLFRSRLVVERETRLGFPLAIFSHWFAAQSISATEVDLDEVLIDGRRAERWMPAIELQMNLEPDRGSATRVLVLRRPGLASQIIEQRDAGNHKVNAPEAIRAGAALRDAVGVWASGLGKAALLTSCIDSSGDPRPLGIRVSGEWVECAWLGADAAQPAVTELTEPLFGRPVTWSRRYLTARGASWCSPWRRGLAEIRSSLTDVVKARAIPIPEALMPEAAWYFTQQVVGLQGWGVDSVPLEQIRRISNVLSKSGTLVLGRRRFALDDVHNKILPYIEHELGGVSRRPWPGPDRLVSGDVLNCFDSDTLLRRTRSVYGAALSGYLQIATTWFSGLLPDLEHARQLPARMKGIVSIETGGPMGPFPSLIYTMLPAPNRGFSEVDLTFEDQGAVAAYREEMRKARMGYTETILYDTLTDDPATDLAYGWLERDLRELNWMD